MKLHPEFFSCNSETGQRVDFLKSGETAWNYPAGNMRWSDEGPKRLA